MLAFSSCYLMKDMFGWKKWLSLSSRALGVSCRHEFEKGLFCFPRNNPKSVMHTCEVFCGLETWNLHSICIPSTPSHWLICSRKRSSFLRPGAYTRTSISSMMVPHLNSVVFYYKTTTWSCLFWTACSQVCSRTSSCFGACYRSSFPENLATSSRWFLLQTFFSRHAVWNIPLPTRSESQADMMVGSFPVFAFCSQLAPVIVLVCHGSLPFPMISRNHPSGCLQQGSPHHPFELRQTIDCDCLRLV